MKTITIKINIDSINGDLGYIEFLRERHPDADIECGNMESVWSVCGDGENDDCLEEAGLEEGEREHDDGCCFGWRTSAPENRACHACDAYVPPHSKEESLPPCDMSCAECICGDGENDEGAAADSWRTYCEII